MSNLERHDINTESDCSEFFIVFSELKTPETFYRENSKCIHQLSICNFIQTLWEFGNQPYGVIWNGWKFQSTFLCPSLLLLLYIQNPLKISRRPFNTRLTYVRTFFNFTVFPPMLGRRQSNSLNVELICSCRPEVVRLFPNLKDSFVMCMMYQKALEVGDYAKKSTMSDSGIHFQLVCEFEFELDVF